jgi:hypothetical protein
MGSFDILKVRARLGRKVWGVPATFGPDGWILDNMTGPGRIIITNAPADDVEWLHASISWADHLPTYEELVSLHRAVWPNGWAYQVFAPPADHVNIHPYALHLWGRADGSAQLPAFGAFGTI